MEVLSKQIVDLVTELEPDHDVQGAFEQLLENEMIRRLNRYQLIDRTMRRKYEMSFSEFKDNRLVEERGYSFEVESDFWDWEMALDGIETMKTMMSNLEDISRAHHRPEP
jgi:hypothetical protein